MFYVNVKRLNARQAGASLIEVLSYLGVAAIVAVAAVMLLSGAFSGANSLRAVQEVTGLQLSVKKLFMGQSAGYGTSSLNQELILSSKIPSTLKADTAAPWGITNSWNGPVTVTGATSGTTFEISYGNIPQDICIDLLTGLGSQGWTAVRAGATGTTVVATPITVAGATSGCVASTNTVVFQTR